MNKIIQAALAEVEAATEEHHEWSSQGLFLACMDGRPNALIHGDDFLLVKIPSREIARSMVTALNSHKAALELAAAVDSWIRAAAGESAIEAIEAARLMVAAQTALMRALDRENGDV